MDSLRNSVHELTSANGVPVTQLQHINESLLKKYQLTCGNFLTVLPKEVEIYYVNRQAKPPYIDQNMQCMAVKKGEEDIWALQSNRFGRVYIPLKGSGGIDICLSDSDGYALCCTLKAAEINGTVYWSQQKVRNVVLDTLCQHEGMEANAENRERFINRLNEKQSITLLSVRETSIEGHVYHLHRRALRHRDKVAQLPLRSFMDIWNKQLNMDNVKRITLYMSAHPEEDILEVMRRQQFRYIPAEIRVRYGIGRKVKLYEETMPAD
ncbi:MAG: hypothetical protein IJ511_09480 [Bacteroides sp.]|nr:hypothetical protein [Bacteroides sp.]